MITNENKGVLKNRYLISLNKRYKIMSSVERHDVGLKPEATSKRYEIQKHMSRSNIYV